MNDVIVVKGNSGLGRTSTTDDSISGFITNGVSVVGGAQLDTLYNLASVDDADALGIDKTYDENNTVLVYEHIKEFFRINPNAELYFMLTDQSATLSDLVDPAQEFAHKLLREANGSIKQIGIAYNPTDRAIFASDTIAAITKAQELADSENTQNRPVQIILEGIGFTKADQVSTNLHLYNSKNVTVVTGQSAEIANIEEPGFPPIFHFANYGAVGTLLGAVSLAAVNENVAWVEKFNLFGGTLTAAMLNGQLIGEISTGNLNTINDNGFVFFRTHNGRAGLYFNDSHTCTDVESDYLYIENNRTIDKASRNIRARLLPFLNSPIDVDPDTGWLSPTTIKSFELEGRKALETMQNSNEISGFSIYIDPEQNVLSTSEIVVEFEVVPTGTARTLTAKLNFSNPF